MSRAGKYPKFERDPGAYGGSYLGDDNPDHRKRTYADDPQRLKEAYEGERKIKLAKQRKLKIIEILAKQSGQLTYPEICQMALKYTEFCQRRELVQSALQTLIKQGMIKTTPNISNKRSNTYLLAKREGSHSG